MSNRLTGWVVYEALERGKPCGRYAVCEQAEWDQMDTSRPGTYPLIKAGIANEAEAEQLARTTTVNKQVAAKA